MLDHSYLIILPSGESVVYYWLFTSCATISAGNNSWILMLDYGYTITLSGRE